MFQRRLPTSLCDSMSTWHKLQQMRALQGEYLPVSLCPKPALSLQNCAGHWRQDDLAIDWRL